MSKRRSPHKTTRVQLELPAPSMARLQSLVELTNAASYAEVLRSALKVYKHFIDEQHAGNTLRIVRKDGSIAEVHLLGVD